MACDLTINGRTLPCRNALGGVKAVWIGTTAHTGAGFWNAIDGDGEVDDTAAAKTFNDFLSPKNSSSFSQTVNASNENGTVFYTQTLSLVLNKVDATDIGILENMGKGRLAVVVEDVNGNYFVMGHTNGVELTGGSVTTGTALGDLNGFTLELTAEEPDAAPLMALDVNGDPDTTNASFT